MQVDLPIILSLLLLLQMKSGKKRNLLRFSVLALALGSEYIGASQKKRGKSIVRSIEVETTVKQHQLIVKAGLALVMG